MAPATSDRAGRVIQVIWILGFLIGTTTHVIDLVSGGLDTYAGFPTPLRAYWISLTLLDPVTVILVFRRRRAGVVLGLAVILSDIAVNWTVFLTIGGHPLFGVVNQTVFAIVLVATAVPLWRWMRPPVRR
jgi:hypothetical protein